MDTGQWVQALLFVSAVVGTLVGLLFSWVKDAISRVDDRLEKRCAKMDEKLDRAQQMNREEIRDMRTQVQGVVKMVADAKTGKEKV